MIEIIEYALVGVITSCMYMYVWSKLLDKRSNIKDYKFYIIIAILAILLLLNYLYNSEFIRILASSVMFAITIRVIYNEKLNVCVVTAIMSQIIGLIAEVIFAIIALIVVKGTNINIVEAYSGTLITTCILFLINYILLKIKDFKKINDYLINKTINLNKIIFVILSILIMIIYNYLIVCTYYKINVGVLAILNTGLIIIYIIIIFRFLTTKNDYKEVSDKYVNTLSSLKEYEDILDKYRVMNHENKNQLLTIRAMIVKKDKKIPDYIDTIIDTTIKDNEKVMFDTNIIPAGGLRAIIYSKMLYMKDNDINVKLNADRKVRTVDLLTLDDKLMLDICKIVGVFLDNAIEEVLLLEKKEVIIELYIEDGNLCIAITNNFGIAPDLNKIDDIGYTTKEKGHGYGLTLVQDIINRNSKYLKNIKGVSKNYFTQTLIIKSQK